MSRAAQAKLRLASLSGPTAQPSEAAVVARQVWTGDGVDVLARPSSDGRLLTYVHWKPGQAGAVGIRDLATGQTRLVTTAGRPGESSPSGPVLSPDGKQVAYCWEGGIGQASAIRVIGVDGSNPRALMPLPGAFAHDIVWSPDGRHIAAAVDDYGGDKTSHIALVGVSGGSLSRLKSTGWHYVELGGFSPDGRLLLYSLSKSPSDNDGGIFAIAADGSGESALVQGPANDTQPAWTPDGQAVVFLSDRAGTPGLWMIRVTGSQARGVPGLVRPNVGAIFGRGFSRDGSYFYGAPNSQTDVFIAGMDAATLGITQQPVKLTDRLVGSNSGASWSPDGRLVAFLRGADRRSRTLVVRTMSDGSERTLPTKFLDAYHASQTGPTWFPDSRSLIVSDNDAGSQRVTFRRIDVETGQETPLFEAGYQHLWPLLKMAPDGRSVYYTMIASDPNPNMNLLRLVKRDLETGQESELYRVVSDAVGFFGLSVSPDGARLAFMVNQGPGTRAVVTLPSSGGDAVTLYRGDYAHPTPGAGVWTRDGRYLLMAADDGPSRQRIWAFPASGGEPRKLDLTMQGIRKMDLSPDGLRLVFTGTQSKPELWTISNLIPKTRAAR
ncbi:MAG: hypothetical protein ABI603_01180 [Acidobacteriota bacterium]